MEGFFFLVLSSRTNKKKPRIFLTIKPVFALAGLYFGGVCEGCLGMDGLSLAPRSPTSRRKTFTDDSVGYVALRFGLGAAG